MSIFKPPQTKPRQFNYLPRYYDPVKEERERRRRELHGTSSNDDEPYTPGKYVRTQREARDASRGERGGFAGVGRIVVIGIVLIVAILMFYPRFIRFAERANQEKMAMADGGQQAFDMEDDSTPTITLYEKHGDIDFREFESLTPEALNEIEEWQNSVGEITIYDDDVEIVDGKRVDGKR